MHLYIFMYFNVVFDNSIIYGHRVLRFEHFDFLIFLYSAASFPGWRRGGHTGSTSSSPPVEREDDTENMALFRTAFENLTDAIHKTGVLGEDKLKKNKSVRYNFITSKTIGTNPLKTRCKKFSVMESVKKKTDLNFHNLYAY